MKKSILLFFLYTFIFNISGFALPNRPIETKKEAISAKAYKKAAKKQKKLDRKKAKIEKKFKKIEKKLAKKGIDISQARGSVWDDDNFRLGALVGLGGLLLTLLGVLPILGGVFAFIGGLMLIVGIGVMIWALIEYNN